MVYDPNTPSEAPPPMPSETPTTPPPEGPPSPPNEAPPGGPAEAPPGGPPEHQPIERVITEARVTPWLSVVFGWGAMVPLALAALGAWTLEGAAAELAATLGLIWGAALVLFLAGVRRGLSFRTPGGPRPGEIAAMLWLFGLGFAALLTPAALSAALLALAFASLAVLDPRAARRGEAPPFFARLRPAQMAAPTLAAAALLVHAA